jgi:hypothetical protein
MVERGSGRIINITSQAGAHRWPLVSGYSVSKAAVIKLTENLAHEAARYGVGVFSVHPGLLPIGMSTSVTEAEPATRHERQIQAWTRAELRNGRGADPRAAVDLIVRIAAGDADTMSGRHLSVHDDLDALIARHGEIRDRDLYVMRPERLHDDAPAAQHTPPARPEGSRPSTARPHGAPAYYRGRPIGVWLSAIRRKATV